MGRSFYKYKCKNISVIVLIITILLYTSFSYSLVNDVYGILGDAAIPDHFDTRIAAITGTTPPRLHFIDLTTTPFSVLGSGSGLPGGAPSDIVYYNNFVYYCTQQSPAVIHKVNAITFAWDSSITLAVNENDCKSLAIDSNGFIYAGISTPAGQNWKVVKIGTNPFARIGVLGFGANGTGSGASSSISSDFLYVQSSSTATNVAEISLSTFTVISTNTITGGAGGGPADINVIPILGLGFVDHKGSGGTSPHSPCSFNINPLGVETCVTIAGTPNPRRVVTDRYNNMVYITSATVDTVWKFTSIPFVLVTSLFPSIIAAVDSFNVVSNEVGNSNFLYVTGELAGSGYVIKIDLSTFTEVGTLQMTAGANPVALAIW